jgi:hypothetical protein
MRMRLKDYLIDHTDGSLRGHVRGVVEWLEDEARMLERPPSSNEAAQRLVAGAFRTAAEALRTQTVECWP